MKFKDWFIFIGGKSIKIDSVKRTVLILNDNSEVIAIAHMSKSIIEEYSQNRINIAQEIMGGSKSYFVKLQGVQNKNWLFKRDTIGIL